MKEDQLLPLEFQSFSRIQPTKSIFSIFFQANSVLSQLRIDFIYSLRTKYWKLLNIDENRKIRELNCHDIEADSTPSLRNKYWKLLNVDENREMKRVQMPPNRSRFNL